MLGKIRGIIDEFQIEYWGVCNFSLIKDNLISCRAMEKLPENPESIISFIFPYKVETKERNISRYAVIEDYHDIIKSKLSTICKKLKDNFSENLFVSFVDNSPIPEVRTAALSGLGVIGKNNLLINRKYGSWVFIGEVVTDMEIEFNYDGLYECLNCESCKKNCPTGALNGKHFEKEKCLSYITQKKGRLTEEEENILKRGKTVWGCDICQEKCPMNKDTPYTKIEEFRKNVIGLVKPGDYVKLKDRAFHWRPESVIERNIKLLDQ